MTVIRIAVMYITLSTAIFWKTHALVKAKIVRELIITTPNSTTIPMRENLYTVSKNRTHVHINSTNADYEPCTIAIDPFEDLIQGKMQVETDIDQNIFIWGVQSRESNNGISSTYYSVLCIKPLKCNYQTITIPESDDVKVPKDFLPRLIQYNIQDKYLQIKIFYPSLQKCRPCQFSSSNFNELVRRDSIFKLQSAASTSNRPFHILCMERDCFYVHNLEDGRAVLQYIGQDYFNILKQKYVNYTVEAIAVKKSNIRNVGFCTKNLNNELHEEIRCERLNSKMQTVVSISIPTSEKNISSISLHYDDQGNSYISFAENHKISVYIYDLYGKMLQSYDLGEIDSSSRFWDVHGFLVGNHQYCVIIEQMTDDYTVASHVVKCIGV